MKNILKHIALIAIVFSFQSTGYGQEPDLGASSSFSLFTSAGIITNIGPSIILGDVGTNIGSISGFPPGTINGETQVVNAITAQTAIDLDIAYNYLKTMTCDVVLGTALGNDQILGPNTYCIGAATSLNGNLTLDAQGDPDALFIFQIDGALSTGISSNVNLINSASLCKVYWQINGAFNLGDSSVFKGTIVANGAINLLDRSSIIGRGLSIQGAINLKDNMVIIGVMPLTTITADGSTNFGPGDSVGLTANLSNSYGTVTYLWNPYGESDSSITAAPIINTQYIVNVSSINCCLNGIDSIEITVNTLPIEIQSFSAVCSNKIVVLNWITASETNNDYFSVEHRSDIASWQVIGIVKGSGNSYSPINYTFNDNLPYNSISYYRLKQTDYNGNFSYYKTVAIKNCARELITINIYPNPAKQIMNFKINEDKPNIKSISIYSSAGEMVYYSELNHSSIDLTNMNDGIYFLNVILASKVITKKFMIKK